MDEKNALVEEFDMVISRTSEGLCTAESDLLFVADPQDISNKINYSFNHPASAGGLGDPLTEIDYKIVMKHVRELSYNGELFMEKMGGVCPLRRYEI